ncbi:hypothetical protein [Sulfitobacter sp. 1A12779]|uniref:hypothetical protein n=1 Tax=Sulfitobacter sp. 1A12779 TaxID=3368599 RepID=UPI00374566FF
MAPPSSMGKNTLRLRSFGAGSGTEVDAGGDIGLDVAALGFSAFSGAGLDELPLGLDAAAEARDGAGSAAGFSLGAGLSLGAALVALVLGSSLGEAVWGFVSLGGVALSGLSVALSSDLAAAAGVAVALSVVGVVLDVFDGSALPVSVFGASGFTSSVFGASGFAVSAPLPSVWLGFAASAFSAVVALSAAGGV